MSTRRKRSSRSGRPSDRMERDEPDWDYQYAPPTSIERDRSTSSIGSPWTNHNNDSIVAPPSIYGQEQTSSQQGSTTTRRLSHLEVLCTNHDCAVSQEPQSLYYRTISTNAARPSAARQRPSPRRQQQATLTPPLAKHRVVPREKITSTSRRRRDLETNQIKMAMQQNLVDSAQQKRNNNSVPAEIVIEKETSLPPSCRITPSSLVGSSVTPRQEGVRDRHSESKRRERKSRREKPTPVPISEITIGQGAPLSDSMEMDSSIVESAESLSKEPSNKPTPSSEAPSCIMFERQEETALPPSCHMPSFGPARRSYPSAETDLWERQSESKSRGSGSSSGGPKAASESKSRGSGSSSGGPKATSESKSRGSGSSNDRPKAPVPISEVTIGQAPSEGIMPVETSVDDAVKSPSSNKSTPSSKGTPVITFERQEETSLPLGCRMPSFGRSLLASQASPPPPTAAAAEVVTASRTSSSSGSEERTSPTSVNDIVEELSDLQDQLDALRMTKSTISKEEFVDAAFKAKHEELVEFPVLDETLVDGLAFQAFESQRDAPDTTGKPSAFSAFVDALHKHEPPDIEEAFVDEGVRLRHFGAEGDSPSTPDSSFSISVQEVEESSPPKREKSASLLPREQVKARSSGRDAPEPFTPPESSTKKQITVAVKKKRSKTKPSSTTKPSRSSRTVSESPRWRSNPFSIRGALASVRARSTLSSEGSFPEEEEATMPKKSVRFSNNLIASTHYRPKTTPEEMDTLYFSTAELEELERDREERIYEEQFEILVGPNNQDVSVTYPIRRVDNLPSRSGDVRRRASVEKPLPPPPSRSGGARHRATSVKDAPPSPPELLDISGSWSNTSSEQEVQQGTTAEI